MAVHVGAAGELATCRLVVVLEDLDAEEQKSAHEQFLGARLYLLLQCVSQTRDGPGILLQRVRVGLPVDGASDLASWYHYFLPVGGKSHDGPPQGKAALCRLQENPLPQRPVKGSGQP